MSQAKATRVAIPVYMYEARRVDSAGSTEVLTFHSNKNAQHCYNLIGEIGTTVIRTSDGRERIKVPKPGRTGEYYLLTPMEALGEAQREGGVLKLGE